MYEETIKNLRFYEKTGLGAINPYEAGLIADALEDFAIISDKLHETHVELEDMKHERNYFRDAYYTQLKIKG